MAAAMVAAGVAALTVLVIVVVAKLTPAPSKEVTDDFDTYMELDV